jgi:hypothetical protein
MRWLLNKKPMRSIPRKRSINTVNLRTNSFKHLTQRRRGRETQRNAKAQFPQEETMISTIASGKIRQDNSLSTL